MLTFKIKYLLVYGTVMVRRARARSIVEALAQVNESDLRRVVSIKELKKNGRYK